MRLMRGALSTTGSSSVSPRQSEKVNGTRPQRAMAGSYFGSCVTGKILVQTNVKTTIMINGLTTDQKNSQRHVAVAGTKVLGNEIPQQREIIAVPYGVRRLFQFV